MKYRIGEVSKILGISPDLLRYYERKGVVKPEKHDGNDYRYYDAWDINFLLDCLWFKNMGFSIEQTAKIVHIEGLDKLNGMLEANEDRLREEIKRSQLLLRRSGEQRAELAAAKELLGKCEIAASPEYLRFLNRTDSEYKIGRETEKQARRWLEVMPLNHRCFVLSEDGRCSWGYSLGSDYAAELGFAEGGLVERVLSKKCVHTVFKSAGGRDGFRQELLDYAREYAENAGLTRAGNIFGALTASVEENGVLHGIFEAWLPVE